MGAAAGGGADLTARQVQKLMREKLGLDFSSSVVNKTGGGSSLSYVYLNQIGQGHRPALTETGAGAVKRGLTDFAMTQQLKRVIHCRLLIGCEATQCALLAQIVDNIASHPYGTRGRRVGVPDVGAIHLARHGDRDKFLQLLRQTGLVTQEAAQRIHLQRHFRNMQHR